jgi:hypothetical protein
VEYIAHYQRQEQSVTAQSKLACRRPTLVKPVHIQLPDEGGDIGMFEVGSATVSEKPAMERTALTRGLWRIPMWAT